MDIEMSAALPWVIYAVGLVLLALSMLWDVNLSLLPHLAVAIGALIAFGWTWPGALAFVAPHLVFFGLKVVSVTLSDGPSPPA